VSLAVALLLVATVAVGRAQQTEADVYVGQAIVDFEDKRYEAAWENLRRALSIDPEHPEALYYSGLVELARRHPEQAAALLERARAKAPGNPAVGFNLGVAYFAQEQYDRAQPLLEGVFRTHPTLDGLGYYVGFMRYRNKDYQGAVAAFRAGRASDPDVQQLMRLYWGLAQAVLGLPAQAAAQIEEGMRIAPGSALTGPAERLRDAVVAARQRQRRYSAEVRLGAFYDDNVAVVPDRDTDELAVPSLRHPKHRSTGELGGARLEYTWYRDEAWDATIGYSFFGTYNNDLPSFNVTNHLASLGASRSLAVGSMPAQVGAQYAWDILFLNEEEFVRRHTFTLFGTLVESQEHLTQVFGRYQNKEFDERVPPLPKQEVRDADNYTIGALHVLRFAQDQHFLKGGYQFDYEDTEGMNYAYYGHRLLAGGQYTLPWYGIRLKYDLDVHLRDYVHRNNILPTYAPGTKERFDAEVTNVVRAELPLPYNLTLSAEYQLTRNLSNIEVFHYARNVVSMILSWRY